MAAEVEISDTPSDPVLSLWFQPLLEHGTSFCAPNLLTTPAFLRTPGIELPLTVNDAEWDNSWICSPWTHYVSYAREEILHAAGKWTGRIAAAALGGLGSWFRRADFNRVVMVNNWLLSTNPWPRWDAANLPSVIAALVERWPDHALVFRSLNPKESDPLISALERRGALLVPSRQVWWYEPDSQAVTRSRDFRKDLAFLRRNDLETVPHESLADRDFPELVRLYEELYLRKYSRHNPQFTEGWFRHLHHEGLARFTALRMPEGGLVGVEASCELHGVLTSPVVGYELEAPRSLGLYRRLAALPVLEARKLGLPLNLSAGVGRYKALRGGEAVMEYLGVYDRHLPARRRHPWRGVHAISKHLLAPYVKRRKL